MPQETAVEERPIYDRPSRSGRRGRGAARAGVEGITRRSLIAGAAGAAGAGLTAAVVIPVIALGPGLDEQLSDTPWYAGRALVDDEGGPILAANSMKEAS